ncbi:MAG: carboxyl-terminal processing protease [Planctomycetota bacterium]|jgi:carboxyl-terminal processing protease
MITTYLVVHPRSSIQKLVRLFYPGRLMRLSRNVLFWVLALVLTFASSAEAQKKAGKNVYKDDMSFALHALEKDCGHFFQAKGIQWKKVRSEFSKAAKKTTTDQEHFIQLVRLLARVKDGHARVELGENNQDFEYPKEQFPQMFGPGMFWSRIGKKYYIRNVRGDAAELGLKPGMEILKVNKEKVSAWFEARREFLCDTNSFSTDHHADHYALNWGLAHERDTRLKLLLVDLDGGKLKRTVTCTAKYFAQEGPVAYPGEVQHTKDLHYATTPEGFGYVHIRRCKGNLPEQMDEALVALGDVPGLILDFRGNSGGGFDHDAFYGRFVPEGKVYDPGTKKFASAGPNPYGGPIVVIVDGTVRSAGETASGMFKEDYRGYMIGESPTAGMSASKKTIPLPSGKFKLYVAVNSNKSRYQGGRGIEGIGIEPHELVLPLLEDLKTGKDTQIQRAVAVFEDFPEGVVRYKPKKFGWSPKAQ